jgi:hypothetical protein
MGVASVEPVVFPARVASALALKGPGLGGADGPQSLLLFDAAIMIDRQDLFSAFYRDEFEKMEWLHDFRQQTWRDLAQPDEEDEDDGEYEDEMFSKDVMAQIATDVGWQGDSS